MFFRVLSFYFVFFLFVGCSKSDFFLTSISSRFLLTFLQKKNFRPVWEGGERGGFIYTFGASFPFFPPSSFPPFFCLFLKGEYVNVWLDDAQMTCFSLKVLEPPMRA